MAISVATVAGLIISYLFINWIGYIGAAVAYFLMGNFLLIILFYGSRRYYRYDLSFNTIISIFVSLICLGCITYMTSRFGIFIAIPLAAAVYYACLKVAGQLTNTRLFGRLL
jgi:O-antigen/teichoic acid export membrane protein